MRSRNPGVRARTGGALLAVLVVLALLPASSRAQGAAPDLTGLFSVRITPQDLPAGQSDDAVLLGFWTLALGEDGAFSLARQDVGEVASGTFRAGEVNLEFTAWRGLVGCAIPAEAGAPATYAWRLQDGALVLTAIDDVCAERLTLLTTRPLGALGACPTPAPAANGAPTGPGFGTPVSVAPAGQGVAAQEGAVDEAAVDAEIDRLLRQTVGCWATRDVAGFMMLHSRRLAAEIGSMGPVEDFNRELRNFMATPLTLARIGDVTLTDATHAWAYVEIGLRGGATPQRVDFVLENGAWVFDSFFLFGPPLPMGPPVIAP